MRTCRYPYVSVALGILLVLLCSTAALAQEGVISSDGRPAGAQPGPVPTPTEEEPVGEPPASDLDEPGVFAEGDVTTLGQVIPQDLIVQGSECIGIDCESGELFDFDTLRFKENNLRIHFQDTSSAGAFPSNDWRVVINDRSSDGANYFSVNDSDAGVRRFVIEPDERTSERNALYLEDDGDLGIRTPDPILDVHARSHDSPGIRLEQVYDWYGWADYIWDVAGNETNFFIRDVTNSSKLPFRIHRRAPDDSLVIGGVNQFGNRPGYIGLGTDQPEAALHVVRPSSSWRPAKVLIEEYTSAAVENRTMLELVNNGDIRTQYWDRNSDAAWVWAHGSGGVSAVYSDTASLEEQEVFHLAPNGNLTIEGTLVESSDANRKTNFAAVDGSDVLERIADMPIQSWNFKHDDPAVRHVGPTAQDFHAAFGLGEDELHIAPLDANGVSLAAIQVLYQQLQTQNARIETLEQQNAALQAQIARLGAQ